MQSTLVHTPIHTAYSVKLRPIDYPETINASSTLVDLSMLPAKR